MISTLHQFPDSVEATRAGEAFLRLYPPQGYGSWYRVSEAPLGGFQLLCVRFSTCD